MTFCYRKTNFVQSRSGIYYSLLLGCFGLKFLPDVRNCVDWILDEIWAPYSSHKTGNKFFIDHCQGWRECSFVCETVWFFSWVNTHAFDLKFVAYCPKFSGDSYVEFQEKTISGEFFRNFVQTKAILYQNLWNFALLSAIFILDPYSAEKIHTSTFICCCTQVRTHVHKQITKRGYAEEKKGRSVFEKPVLFSLGLGLTTAYSWVFWSEIFTRRSKLGLLSFGLDLCPRFVPQDWH